MSVDVVLDRSQEFYSQELTWSPTAAHPRLHRTSVSVPLNHFDPAGAHLDIAVTRMQAIDPARRRGVLVALNGGPGGDETLGTAIPLRFADTPLNEVYDLVGFDPRGYGESAPVFRGDAPATAGFDSRPDDATFPLLAADARALEDVCRDGGGSARPHLTTRNTARDLDIVRSALGEEKLTYVGYAYGSYVGAVYGALFRGRLDRIVLDSCVHPDWLWRTQFMMQAVAIRENVDAWAGWVGERHGRFGLGRSATEVFASVEELADVLIATPVAGVGRTVLDGAIGNGATLRMRWEELADIVGELRAGRLPARSAATVMALAGAGLRAGTYPSYTPEQLRTRAALTERGTVPMGRSRAVMHAVTGEAVWPADLDIYRADVARFREQYPYGYGVARAQPWVSTFAATPPREPLTVIARGDQPAGLVVQAEGDPLNHHAGAAAMAERLGHHLVVVADDGGHELYPEAGNAEVDRLVTRYLLDGELPAERITRVAGAPRPDVPADAPARLEERSSGRS